MSFVSKKKLIDKRGGTEERLNERARTLAYTRARIQKMLC